MDKINSQLWMIWPKIFPVDISRYITNSILKQLPLAPEEEWHMFRFQRYLGFFFDQG